MLQILFQKLCYTCILYYDLALNNNDTIIIPLWQGLKRKGKVIYHSSSIQPEVRREGMHKGPKGGNKVYEHRVKKIKKIINK